MTKLHCPMPTAKYQLPSPCRSMRKKQYQPTTPSCEICIAKKRRSNPTYASTNCYINCPMPTDQYQKDSCSMPKYRLPNPNSPTLVAQSHRFNPSCPLACAQSPLIFAVQYELSKVGCSISKVQPQIFMFICHVNCRHSEQLIQISQSSWAPFERCDAIRLNCNTQQTLQCSPISQHLPQQHN